MAELVGIPKTKDEYLLKIIDRIGTEAGITHFDVGQIDIVHKASPKASAFIIILFIKKSDQINFYIQNKKFYSLDAESFVEKHYDDNESGHVKTYELIYLYESFCPQNRLLLKEAWKTSKELKC